MNTVTVNTERIYEVGDLLMQTLAEHEVEVGYGALAGALILARLSNNKTEELTTEEEVEFLKNIMDWISTYWSEGTVN